MVRQPPQEALFHVPSARDIVSKHFVLKCEATGDPEPKYTWTKNHEKFDYDLHSRRIKRLPGHGSLLFLAPEDGDEGLYQCRATNEFGTSVSNVLYLRRAELKRFPDEDTKNVSVKEGEPLSLHCDPPSGKLKLQCIYGGTPQPATSWSKGGVELASPRFTYSNNSNTLTIKSVQFEDEGTYECRVDNGVGPDLKHTMNVTVEAAPYWLNVPNNTNAAEGQMVAFKCDVMGLPKPNLEWFVNGVPISSAKPNPRRTVLGNVLTIESLDKSDTAVYQCNASNVHGYAFRDFYLNVREVPSPPVLVHVECDNGVAIVKWRPTRELRTPVLSYVIQHNTGSNSENWEDTFVNIPETERKLTVAMRPWANYTFRVLARNEFGFSKPSETSAACVTPEDVPHKNPDNVMGRGDRSDNLVISWTPMPRVEHNAPGFFYKVFWKRDDLPEASWNYERIEDWKLDKHIVNEQPTYKPYRIKVEAHNSRGQANTTATEVIGHSGEGVPLEAPAEFRLLRITDARTAEFSWRPVHQETVRGPFRGYKIETWTAQEGEEKLREVVVPADATTALVSLFRPFSWNVVRLRVFNDQYNGPATDTIEFTTPKGTPGPVASFKAIPLGSTAFYLLWQKPSQVNGVVTSYNIYYQEVHGTQVGPMMELRLSMRDPLASHAKLVGLKPRTTYRIAIRASTADGFGDPYITEARTSDEPERLPDVPDFMWVHLPDGNPKEAIQVTWLPALKGHPGSHFYVQYRRKGDRTWEATTSEEYEDTIIVHGLEKKTLYEFRVIAVDGKHEQPSVVEEVYTGVPDWH
ncbi:hypothetical protein HPB48_018695 [Haemaphysalis longicornis]|uniref:Uncharacterized protein n=1 Tax=Haemaphysalis longicornis TaxID=44386 RepID=A0A9J6FQH8_HAELO|nr:hypothetical protein HPB48_018695 [Haemaphysalis longicornis]